MSKNVFSIALCAMLFALCSSAEAQQRAKVTLCQLINSMNFSELP
jgi:hypothetical protein